MITWQKLPRSLRYTTTEVEVDVWAFSPGYRYSVYDRQLDTYTARGNGKSEDEACELALKAASLRG